MIFNACYLIMLCCRILRVPRLTKILVSSQPGVTPAKELSELGSEVYLDHPGYPGERENEERGGHLKGSRLKRGAGH